MDVDRVLEEQILELLAHRDLGRTICVSEAARAVHRDATADRADPDSDGWRALMEPARQAARRLVDAGEIVITQRGQVVDPATARGPIRLRRVER
jgi:hypothetical protein